MPTLCVSPIKARVARITKNDICGVPVTGTGGQVVTNGFIQITPSPEYEEGEEFLQKNANGDPCVNEKDPNFLKRVGLQIDFCNIDPDAIVLMTGERLLVTGSATGTGVAFGEGLLLARFGLEVWQPLAGAGACSATGQQFYMYWAFPNVGNAMVNDWNFENAPLTFSVSGDTKAASPLWNQRMGAPVTAWLNGNTIASDEHFAFNITTAPPPTPLCGAQTL
jgi:hypothetical protein